MLTFSRVLSTFEPKINIDSTVCDSMLFLGMIMRALHDVELHRGAVFQFSKSHGAVWCGFQVFKNHTMPCGAVRFFSLSVWCGADYIFQESYSAVRLPVEQLFPTVQLSVYRR